MNEWDEQAEDYAVAHHTYEHERILHNETRYTLVVAGARWQREALRSDEVIERAARTLTPYLYWNYDEWDDASQGDRDTAIHMARAALTAALGEDENDD